MSHQLIVAIGRESGSGGSTMTSTAKVTGAMPNATIW